MTPTPRSLTVLSAKDVARCLPSTADAIAVIEAAYLAKASGEGRLGLRGYMDAPEHPSGTFFTTQGIVPSRNVAGSKVIGSFPGNRQQNLPSESGLLTLFDASTGHPLAIMDACQWRRQIVPDGGVKVYQSG